MIELSTGAVLDRSMSPQDFVDGRKYGSRLGLLATFIPCDFCVTGCRRSTYTRCIDEYLTLWTGRNAQRTMDSWGPWTSEEGHRWTASPVASWVRVASSAPTGP